MSTPKTTYNYSIVVRNADEMPTPPEGLKYIHIVDERGLEGDNEHYPVLKMGNIEYWGTLSPNSSSPLLITPSFI